MSWDKCTWASSEVDTIISILDEFELPYTVDVLAQVHGQGRNDSDTPYPIRKLSYGNKVVVEQMQRHPDCDYDDIIASFRFSKDEFPDSWLTDIVLQVEGYLYWNGEDWQEEVPDNLYEDEPLSDCRLEELVLSGDCETPTDGMCWVCDGQWLQGQHWAADIAELYKDGPSQEEQKMMDDYANESEG